MTGLLQATRTATPSTELQVERCRFNGTSPPFWPDAPGKDTY